MSLVVVGSVAYDGVETPHGKVERMLGGACTYISLAASYSTKVKIVGVMGEDFDPADYDLLAGRGRRKRRPRASTRRPRKRPCLKAEALSYSVII